MSGIYVVEPGVLEYIPDGFADFGFDVFPALLAAGVPIYARPIDEGTYLLDIGSLERYDQACADAAARTVLAPTQLPVGAIMALLGAPLFIALLRQRA